MHKNTYKVHEKVLGHIEETDDLAPALPWKWQIAIRVTLFLF